MQSSFKSRSAPPKASAMVEALRGLGYNTQTALADIIDNSIAAGANEVHIEFIWAEQESRVLCLDNGSGMTADELDRAMRLGDRNPLEERSAGDLGRFGLGLKTASFSQCRRMTVATRGPDGLQTLRWDLDFLASSADDGWHLLEGPHPGSEGFLERLTSATGTLVLWKSWIASSRQGLQCRTFSIWSTKSNSTWEWCFTDTWKAPGLDCEFC